LGIFFGRGYHRKYQIDLEIEENIKDYQQSTYLDARTTVEQEPLKLSNSSYRFMPAIPNVKYEDGKLWFWKASTQLGDMWNPV